MINFNRNLQSKQKGFALLVTALILMLGISLTALILAKSIALEQKMIAYHYRVHQAFQAAEAGLEFAVAYLNANKATILVNDPLNTGYIPALSNAQVTNVAFANNTTYSITYTNPVANNFKKIRITSVGTADASSVTRTITELLQVSSFVVSVPPTPLTALNNVNISGTVAITNPTGTNTIWSGGSTTLGGSATTSNSSGVSSNSTSIKSDVSQNSSALSSLSGTQFFSNFFGEASTTVQQNADILYNNSGDTNYSGLLNGVTGKSIWINQTGGTANLSSNSIIGSAASPVVLVVNGSLKANGNTTIYGMVYVTGNWDNSGGGTLNIIGAVAVQGSMTGTGTPNITYNPTVLSNVQNIGALYKIPGSWIDS